MGSCAENIGRRKIQTGSWTASYPTIVRLAGRAAGDDGKRMAAPHIILGLLTCAVAGCAAAGCGSSADRDQARAATEQLYAAVQRGDGATACAQMSPDLRAQLVKDQAEPRCAKAVLKLSLAGGKPVDVRVYADAAMVRLAGGDTAFLGDTAEGWRVQAVGCRPNGKGPFDCQEQA